MSDGAVEEILFRHSATVKGKDGVLEISQACFSFTPAARGQPRRVFTWPNVASIKYSPFNDPKGRAMVLLKTVLQEGETVEDGIVVQLVGPSNEQNFRELERAKGIISNIRRVSKASAAAAAEGIAEAKRRKALSSDPDGSKLKKRRLLEADHELGRHYKELVEDRKIVTDEEFWTAHESALIKALSGTLAADTGGSNGSSEQGRRRKIGISEMLSPEKYLEGMIERMRNASGELDITAQQKQEIFMMIPVLKKAFQEEVEKEVKSEEEFWYSLFQRVLSSQSSSTGAGAGAGGAAAAAGEGGVLEDFYARYGYTDDEMFPGAATGGRVSGRVDEQLDLTGTFGDYRPQERLDLTDFAEKLARVGNAMAKKYNKFSSYELMAITEAAARPSAGRDSLPRAHAHAQRRRDLAHSLDMAELEKEKPPSYIPISLADEGQRRGDAAGKAAGDADGAADSSFGSAFASGSTLVRSSLVQKLRGQAVALDGSEESSSASLQRQRSDSVDMMIGIFELDPPGLLASDLGACLPAADRSCRWFEADLRRLRTQGASDREEVESIGTMAGGSQNLLDAYLWLNSTAASAASLLPRTDAASSGSSSSRRSAEARELACRHEIERCFKDVCELLRLFYCALGRAEDRDMKSGAKLRGRMNGIIEQLTSKCSVDLDKIRAALKKEGAGEASFLSLSHFTFRWSTD